MTPDAITRLFKEAYDTFPPLKGKPTDGDLLAIREALLPLLMVIPYDQLNGVHSLTAILTEAVKYEAEHGNAKFVRSSRLPLYDKNIADDATTVVRVRAEAAHKARLDDYASYKAAERGVAKFLRDVVDKIWYNDLKSAFDFNVTIIIFGWFSAFIPCRALRRNLWRVPVPTVHPPHPEITMMSGCRRDQLPMALPSLRMLLAPENTPFSSNARSA
jgi:hypothetical protein